MRVVVSVAFAAILMGCVRRNVRTSTAPLPPPPYLTPARADLYGTSPFSIANPDSGYIDLQPGWRLRVITPLLKSGGYRLRLTGEESGGDTVTFSAGNDFEGFESTFYAIEPREEGGVRVEFASAQVTKEGKTVQQPRSQAPLCPLPPGARFVRLIYLTRFSDADHDMAVVAADEMGALETLTREVQASRTACKSGEHSFCSWIPAGIAVRPEVRTAVGNAEHWSPAR